MSKNPTVVFPEPRKVVIEDREVPPPSEGVLLIKTLRTLISTGTELTILTGEFPPDSVWGRYGRFPFTPGYDNVGQVIGVCDTLDKTWIGKRVCTYSAHAQYVTARPNQARVIDRDIPDEEAAFFTIAEIVMNGVRRSGLQWGESAAVFGLGLLGQMTVAFCRICGARPVFAVDVAETRLALLPKDAAVVPVNPQKADLAAVIEKETRGRKVDVAFEVTGNAGLIPSQVHVLRKQGRFVILSSPRGKTQFDFHDLCNSPSITIIGAHNSSHPPVAIPDHPWTQLRHAELFFDLVADGELSIAALITHRAPYTQAPALYDMLLKDRSQAMGVILDWTCAG